jgi:hypothetical protein
MKFTNAFYLQKVDLPNVKARGTYGYHDALLG